MLTALFLVVLGVGEWLRSYTGLLSQDIDGPVFGCFRGRGMGSIKNEKETLDLN